MMKGDTKNLIFDHYRDSLSKTGISMVYEDSLVCPLCWRETRFADLSVEHAVPGSVGGTAKVLTCRKCNNEHGSSLDAHLAQFQTIADAFQGHGTIPTELNVNGKKLVANLEWSEQNKNFIVVGKATDPRMQDLVKADIQAGSVSEINVTFSFGYSKDRFQTAILRAAYLVLFKCFGYQYVNHEVVQILRRRICDISLEFPRLGSFILELRNSNLPQDEPHLVASGDVKGVPFFLVILRVKKNTISYLGAFMPHPSVEPESFFQLMEQCSREQHGATVTIPTNGWFI